MSDVLDLDVFAPPRREVKFTDRAGKAHAFDVTFISFETGLSILAKRDQLAAIMQDPGASTPDTFRMIAGLIADIGGQTDKALTADFILRNLSVQQGAKLLEVAMMPLLEYVSARGNPTEAAGAEK